MNNSRVSIPYNAMIDTFQKLKTVLTDAMKTAFILLITVALSEALLYFSVSGQVLILLYLLSVLVTARLTSGYTYGILASVISTFAYDFLVFAPRMGFSYHIGLGFPINLCIMLFVAFSTSALTTQMKKQTKLALEREQRALHLYEINQKLMAVRDVESIAKIVINYLIDHVQRPVIFYVKDPLQPGAGLSAKPPINTKNDISLDSESEREKAHALFINPASADEAGVLRGDTYYVPVVSKDKVLGLIGVSIEADPLSQPGILFIQMLAIQAAIALELQYLSDEQNKILMDTEREKTRAMLLQAISHDLRTPLTSILGASTTILDQKDLLDQSAGRQLIADIKNDVQWLIRVVENLLAVTKITHGVVRLCKTEEAAEEVAAQSVSIVRKRFPEWPIRIKSYESLLLVPMDATLILQVIINLLENSVKNSSSGSPILLEIRKQGEYAKFSVSDSGRGIPEKVLGNLFEAQESAGEQPADSGRGMGIGLSLCKTIVHAHGGIITGRNKTDGGAYFSFLLPLEEGGGVER